ncbi:MAG: DEAD/DEAH box helicase [Hyphomonas sp.]|nr:DEAD/DEAH box helicase [Hyphomonas sp.]
MNPTLLGKQVEHGLKDLIRSSFETSSPAFEGMIETFLDTPGNFLKGPWLSVDLPFRSSSASTEPFPEVPLGFRPHKHQELAFERLRAPDAKSTLVATGTGSGKTECYLWPILDACRAAKDEPGIKAIIIYPMNALATDQARRIAKAIHRIPSLKGVRCGIYADAEPKPATDMMTEADVITSREQMRRDPPDILLTNYKMLDYLLLRGSDKRLWAKNSPETLRYLVVDELHTFDGAQGADLALLIRRLKARLKTPAGHLACVGSSATLGSGDEAAEKLVKYAEDLFGERFEAKGVVREDRLLTHEYLESIDFTDLPSPQSVLEAVEAGLGQTQAQAAVSLAKLFFDDFDPGSAYFDKSIPSDPSDPAWRVALGTKLRAHVAFHRALEAIQASGRAASLESTVDALASARLFRAGWTRAELTALVEAIVILTAWARRDLDGRVQPLLNVRIQTWARELGRMVATIPLPDEGAGRAPGILHHSDDLEEVELQKSLPVVLCRHCGTSGQLCRVNEGGGSIWAPLDTLYSDFFDGGDRIRIVYYEPVQRISKSAGYGAVVPGRLHPESLNFKWEEASEKSDGTLPAWLFNPVDDRSNVNTTCPSCGTSHSLQILGLRSARLTAALSTTLFNSDHHEELDDQKPRVLIFSDSVQDAAQRAAVTEIRNVQTVVRKALYRAVQDEPGSGLPLSELWSSSIAEMRHALGETTFISRFVSRDQTWRQPYVDLSLEGREPTNGQFADDVALRLGWEFFSDLTYRSRTSQTLETARICVADVPTTSIAAAAEDFQIALHAGLGADFALSKEEAFSFLEGLAIHMRRSGAVSHPYVKAAVERGSAVKGPNYFAGQKALGLGNRGVLPAPNQRTSAAPRLPTLRSRAEGFQYVGRDNGANWYRAWSNRFFGKASGGLGTRHTDIFQHAFDTLARHKIAEAIATSGTDSVDAWALRPEAIIVTSQLTHVSCNRCGRRESLPAHEAADFSHACLRIGCSGDLLAEETAEGQTHGSAYLKSVMDTARNHRVVAREHTGILETDDRRKLETLFIEGEAPWHPNLISATPTLEMGIDIGDLSTLILASMPPEEANYVQRIGRTGRRDGNSLNLTLISARPHDLQFWEDPGSMLAGQVTPPGVHLQAIAVLRRQAAAFALDRFVAESDKEIEYGTVNSSISAIERNLKTEFPCNWFDHLSQNAESIAETFLAILPDAVRERDVLANQLKDFLVSDGEESLRYKISAAFGSAAEERAELLELQKRLDNERRRMKEQSPPPTDLEDQLNKLKERRTEISRTIRETINQVKVLRFLTDRGLLPNYAFPEEGVKLKSIIVKAREAGTTQKDQDADLIIREYQRPASSALSEFAPNQTFYAEGRQVTIDRIDLRSKDMAVWRFCPNCTHGELEATAASKPTCPRCTSPMWADSGSRADAVELRSVVATSSEQKAAIRDLDDRTSKQYDREVFPNYADDAIEVAYAVKDGKAQVPFGFEFVPLCEFRDINFGQKTAMRMGQNIAGEQRQSRPFLICKKCGMLQTDGFDKDRDQKPGEHQSRCSADHMAEPRASWETAVYLMRRFTTEALRLIVPVAGRAGADDIKSFVAAIELGLKKHFSGRVDHIRSVVVDERLRSGASVKNLYLYDAIPGGSGYLRQLASNPQTLLRVFRLSAAALRDCRCVGQEGKNGCFRCVKPYRSQFGPGEPKRDLALQMVESVLADWDGLVRVEKAINEVLGAELIESELEARFLDRLQKAFGSKALKPIVLEGGKRGFQLRIEAQGQEIFWQIEPQVQIDKRFPGLPVRRVDFLMSMTGERPDKPMVVELDGWEYHAPTIEEDVETRLRMIRSGKVEVWTLTWEDFEDNAGRLANPFGPGVLDPSSEGTLTKLLTQPQFETLHALSAPIDTLRAGRSMDALLKQLKLEGEGREKAAALFGRIAIGPKGNVISALDTSKLNEDARLFLEEASLFGSLENGGLSAFLGLPNGSPLEIAENTAAARFVMYAEFSGAPQDRLGDEPARALWKGLWRCVNLLQDLRGLHVSMPGLETLDANASDKDVAPDSVLSDVAWNDVRSLVDEDMVEIVTALYQAGLPPPDMIGEDLMDGDKVIGTVDIGWREQRFGFAQEPPAIPNWEIAQLVSFGSPDFSEFLRRVATKVSGGKA